MVVWSSIGFKTICRANLTLNLFSSFKFGSNKKVFNYVPVRNEHERTIVIKSTRYTKQKVKDMINFYLLLGIIPMGLLITYANVFVGSAELAEIPEGYEPKHWEYFSHPITRFIARYIVPSPQETHERNLHVLFTDSEKELLGITEKKVLDLIKDREDYQSWYFEKPVVKYVRKTQELSEKTEFEERGKTAGTMLRE